MKPRWKRVILIAPLAILGMVLLAALGGEIVKQLWNWLLPPIFGWRQLTFWQALAMLALCRILFGGFRLHGGPHGNVRRRSLDRLADRIGERFNAMTPEEQERFRQRLRERCGFGASPSQSKEQ